MYNKLSYIFISKYYSTANSEKYIQVLRFFAKLESIVQQQKSQESYIIDFITEHIRVRQIIVLYVRFLYITGNRKLKLEN